MSFQQSSGSRYVYADPDPGFESKNIGWIQDPALDPTTEPQIFGESHLHYLVVNGL
jgi:hypothetical protein